MSIQLPFNFNAAKLKFWKKRRLTITEYDPVFKVIYLGNVLTPWAKGDNCCEKPLATLWKNYCSNVKHEIIMKLTICNSGLKAITAEHGLTEYWANRITYCSTSPQHPKVFCWIYRHEGKKMKQELRCHAVLCQKESKAERMANVLNQRLNAALQEFRREKKLRQNTRLSLVNAYREVTLIPIRKRLLVKGAANFRPPLERSKSAPKLTSIEEASEDDLDTSDDEDDNMIPCESVTSDIVADDVDSISDQFNVVNVQENHCDRNEMLVDSFPDPSIRVDLNAINDPCLQQGHIIDGPFVIDNEDNVSDESGYSEPADGSTTASTASATSELCKL